MSNKIVLVKKALMEAVHDTGNRSFQHSQETVPVKTGALKASGAILAEPEALTIQYGNNNVLYATIIERGAKGGVVYVKSYRRKDGVAVRAHTMHQQPREGTHFIEKSMRLFFKDKMGDKSFFQLNFAQSLKKVFPNSRIRS